MKKRILACLLAALMTMPMLAGCGDSGAAETTGDTVSAVETELVETEPELQSGIPEGTTFGGET